MDKYKQLCNKLFGSSQSKGFRSDKSLTFQDIDYNFLKKFEAHIISKKKKNGKPINNSTLFFYMRHFRSTYREAMRRGFVDKDLYPFYNQMNPNGYSFSKYKPKPNPRPLALDDLEKIKRFDVESHPELKNSYYFFTFCYYAHGMSFFDMAQLKWTDIYDGFIQYERQKTAKKIHKIKITKPMQEIFDFYKSDSVYVFPILNAQAHITPIQIHRRIHKCEQKINAGLKKIAAILNINMRLTSYVARYTIGKVLIENEVDPLVIQKMYDHESFKTTQGYLDAIQQNRVDAAGALL